MGIILAILAAVTWAIGDFSIERISRRIGSLKALFYISLLASIGYLPFVWRDIPTIGGKNILALLLLSGAVFLFASIFDFLALKTGKISVVEPICAFEVPITALAAYLFIGERINAHQSLLIALMVLGIFLVSVTHFSHLKRIHAEKGAWLALVATVAMGLANYLFAEAGRVTTPFVINWFAAVFILFFLVAYFLYKGELHSMITLEDANKPFLAVMAVADNLSWVFYTFAALTIPISIAIGVSESYIVLASLLGFFFNKERLRGHQIFGMVLCITAVIFLSLSLK
ncbi:MAG: hypothetical protein JWN50_280 [Parcubacteria group bacterium]|nr:hypothetical protein [Parcubacteria group bacterium]